jgi:hypothetical protein
MIGIYKITNPIGQVYVGQSKNLERRKNEHFVKKPRSHFKLKNSITKYGSETHIFETIEECKLNELNTRERYWQEYYNTINFGLNCVLVGTEIKPAILCNDSRKRISLGGSGRVQSEQERQNRIGMNTKIVIDINTGVFYNDASEVSKLYGISFSTLVSWLNTTKRNKSSFRYALSDRIYNDY